MATTRRTGGPATPATPPAPPTVPIVAAVSRLRMKPLLLTAFFIAAFGFLGYYVIYNEKPRKKSHSSGNSTTDTVRVTVPVSSPKKWDSYPLNKPGDKFKIDVPVGHHVHTFADTLHLFQRNGEQMDTISSYKEAKPYNKVTKSIKISFFEVPVTVTTLTAENGSDCKYDH